MPDKKPRRSGAKSLARLLPKRTCRLPSSPAETMRERGLDIGGKPPMKRRAEPLVSASGGRHEIAEKPAGRGLGTFFELSAFCAR